MICMHCGTENQEGLVSCWKCGKLLTTSTPVEPTKQVPCIPTEGTTPSMRSNEVKNWKVKLLYAIAVITLVMGLVAGAMIVIDKDMESASGATKAVAFLSIFGFGVFACGVIAGLGGFISSQKPNPAGQKSTIVHRLYIIALLVFMIFTAVGIIQTTEMDDFFYDGSDKVSTFLGSFIEGLFYAGVIAGLASVISHRLGNPIRAIGVKVFAFYLAALAAFGIGITIATLTISDIGDYASGTGKASYFLMILLNSGIFYAGILASFAVYLSSQQRKQISSQCPNCGSNILDEWKACPYCMEPVAIP